MLRTCAGGGGALSASSGVLFPFQEAQRSSTATRLDERARVGELELGDSLDEAARLRASIAQHHRRLTSEATTLFDSAS